MGVSAIEKRLDIHSYNQGPSRLGWLFNMQTVALFDDVSYEGRLWLVGKSTKHQPSTSTSSRRMATFSSVR